MMERCESFRKACLQSKIASAGKTDDASYAFAELEESYEPFRQFLDSLEAALRQADADPVTCWKAAVAVGAWLDHWQSHDRDARAWLENLEEALESLPGVLEELGVEEEEDED